MIDFATVRDSFKENLSNLARLHFLIGSPYRNIYCKMKGYELILFYC